MRINSSIITTVNYEKNKKKRNCYIEYNENYASIINLIYFPIDVNNVITLLLIDKFDNYGYFSDSDIPIISKEPKNNFMLIEFNEKIKKIGLIKINKKKKLKFKR